jgi:hypothetical protein
MTGVTGCCSWRRMAFVTGRVMRWRM